MPQNYRTPSPKTVAQLAAAQAWSDSDVVVQGKDAHGAPMSITRSQAAVASQLVRRWLIVRDQDGVALLRVVRDFVSADGVLFTVRERDKA